MTIAFKFFKFFTLSLGFSIYSLFLNSCLTRISSSLLDCHHSVDCEKKLKLDSTFNTASLKKNSLSWKVRYNEILLLIKEKKYLEAKKKLAILEEFFTDNTFVMKLKAYLFFIEKDYNFSYEVYQNLNKKLPTDSEILYNLAYLSWFLKKDKKSSEFYLRRFVYEKGSNSLLEKEWVKEMGFIKN